MGNDKKFDVKDKKFMENAVFLRVFKYLDGLPFDLCELDKSGIRYEKEDTDEDASGSKLEGNYSEVFGIKKCKDGHVIDIGILIEDDRLLKTLHLTRYHDCGACKNIFSEISSMGIFEEGKQYECKVTDYHMPTVRKGNNGK